MAEMSLSALTKALRDDGYTARTDAQLQQEAQQRVGETYDTMRGAATQRQEIINDAYEREKQALADALATGQQAVAGQVGRANAAIDDYITSRSMQRTSYGAAAKGSIVGNMQQAAALMQQQYDTASSGVENRRVLLAEQLKGTLAQYDKDYETDVQAYIDGQNQLDYDRKVAADAAYNALQMELFELGKAGSRGGGGSGYRRSYGGSSAPTTQASTGSLFANLASREVQTKYQLNPSFGTSYQTTQKNSNSVVAKAAAAASKKINTAVNKVNLAKAKASAKK
ncbi:MAG: hypothetical protein J6K73_03025 [Clostridia bacterium]|nr:hypothetical protein [Clostridia bacterium]